MRNIVIRVHSSNSEWLQEILPGFEEKASRGAVVEIGPKVIRVDRRREKPYNPDTGETEKGTG